MRTAENLVLEIQLDPVILLLFLRFYLFHFRPFHSFGLAIADINTSILYSDIIIKGLIIFFF
jgi:hypothetical protein